MDAVFIMKPLILSFKLLHHNVQTFIAIGHRIELGAYILLVSSFLGSTAQLRPWPPPQNSTEFLGAFSTIFFFTG
jgi:hypothetical protein